MEQATNGSSALALVKPQAMEPLDWDTPEKIRLIREMYGGKALTNDEFDIFLEHARAVRLSPLTKQIQCIRFDGKPQPYTTIHGMVAIACRSGKYAGVDEIEYDCEPTGKEGEHPNWARATVYKITPAGVRAYRAKVYWTERNRNMATWKTQKWTMLGKCALSAAFKLAWEETAELSVEEELGIENGKIVDAAPVKPSQVKPAPIPSGQQPPFAPPTGKTWPQWCADLAKQLGIFDTKDEYLAFVKEVTGIDPNLKKIPDAAWQKYAHQLLTMIDEGVGSDDAGLQEEDEGLAKLAGLGEGEDAVDSN